MKRKSDAPRPPAADTTAHLPTHTHAGFIGHLRHILGLARGNIHLLNHRLNQRYKPGPDFPLQVNLYLAGGAWPTGLQNISGTGLGLRVDPATPLATGQAARVGLELDHHHLDIRARVAHVESGEDGLFAGIELKFEDFPTQKAYLELMHPVVIGQSLKPVHARFGGHEEPGFTKQFYQGESHFHVMVWREDIAGAPLHSVEFSLNHYSWRVTRPPAAPPGWAPPPAAPDEPKPEPIYDYAGGLKYEIHELFRWIAFNLSDEVPADVRALVHPICAQDADG